MRYDTPIFFRRITTGAYDPTTGNYGPSTKVDTAVYANVQDTGEETMRLIYGAIRKGSLTIKLQNHYNSAFDEIVIDPGDTEKCYTVDRRRKLRVKETLFVSEVQ